MKEIKSLADELRESIRNKSEKNGSKSKSLKKSSASNPVLDTLFKQIQQFELGQEKLLIRLDERTVFLLKQLKISQGLDMNKSIAFIIKSFLEKNPDLTQYIKDSLKSLDL
jgi:hypothetical protein